MIHPVQKSSVQLTSGLGTIGVEFLYFDALNLQAMVNRIQIRTGERKTAIKNDLSADMKKVERHTLFCIVRLIGNREFFFIPSSAVNHRWKFILWCMKSHSTADLGRVCKFCSTIFRKIFRKIFTRDFRELGPTATYCYYIPTGETRSSELLVWKTLILFKLMQFFAFPIRHLSENFTGYSKMVEISEWMKKQQWEV